METLSNSVQVLTQDSLPLLNELLAVRQQNNKPKNEVGEFESELSQAEGAAESVAAMLGHQVVSPILQQKKPETHPQLQHAADRLAMNSAVLPKPWSKDWVFKGGEEMNPDLQTLIPENKPENKNDTHPEDTWMSQIREQTHLNQPPSQPQVGSFNKNLNSVVDEATLKKIQDLNGEINEIQNNIISESQSNHPLRAASHMTGSEFVKTLSGMRHEETPPLKRRTNATQELDSLEDLSKKLGLPENNTVLKTQNEIHSSNGEVLNPLNLKNIKIKDQNQKNRPLIADSNESTVRLMPNSNLGIREHFPESKFPSLGKIEVTGHVVKGAMAQDRLSTEALMGISTGVRNLASQGGGEIRIRLKPENLGELHLRVMTDGSRVGLKIQASDESARRVIEESIGYLKESLAAQNLSLGKVDLSISHFATQARTDQPLHGMLGQQDLAQQSGQRGKSHYDLVDEEDAGVRTLPLKTHVRSTLTSPGRLDVMA